MTRALVAHVQQLAEQLRGRFGDLVVAVWAGGSLALEDVRPASDLDVAVVVDRDLAVEERRDVAGALLACAADAPARGLEAVVYSRGDLAEPGRGRYQVNVNGGPAMADHVGEPGDDPAFWFVVDLAILRSAGRAIAGAPPDELIADVPEDAVRDALRRSLRWHREHDDAPDHEVLNACRAWHHVATGGWASKSEAAEWAAARLDGAARASVRSAAARRADPGRPGPSDEEARMLSEHVLALLGPDAPLRSP